MRYTVVPVYTSWMVFDRKTSMVVGNHYINKYVAQTECCRLNAIEEEL